MKKAGLLSRLISYWIILFQGETIMGKAVIVLLPIFFACMTIASCSTMLAQAITEPSPERSARQIAEANPVAEATSIIHPTTSISQIVIEETSRPQPTVTAKPSNTAPLPPTIIPTDTFEPTSTKRPTSTPQPTPSPTQTSTARPTNTASPIPSPTHTIAPPTATIPLPTATSTGLELAFVTHVVDGDTIEVSMDGAIHRVRYIGIDTPEYNEACGTEATQANAALVAGQTIVMVRDVSETDQYGRLLRYVYIGNTFVNGALVAEGWARAVDYPPDTAMSSLLHSLNTQGSGRGCALVILPTATLAVSVPIAPPAQECTPGYSPCIAPGPDVDCAGGSGNGPRYVQGPINVDQSFGDPYDLDRDGDGIGCER